MSLHQSRATPRPPSAQTRGRSPPLRARSPAVRGEWSPSQHLAFPSEAPSPEQVLLTSQRRRPAELLSRVQVGGDDRGATAVPAAVVAAALAVGGSGDGRGGESLGQLQAAGGGDRAEAGGGEGGSCHGLHRQRPLTLPDEPLSVNRQTEQNV